MIRYLESPVAYGSYIARSSTRRRSVSSLLRIGIPADVRVSHSRASSGGASRSVSNGRGRGEKILARSTIAWRAIANVSLAEPTTGPCIAVITSEHVSRIVVSPATQDWLSC